MRDEREIRLSAWILAPILVFLLLFCLLKTYEHLWTVVFGLDLAYLGVVFLIVAGVALTMGVIAETGFRRLSCYLIAFASIIISLQILCPMLFYNFLGFTPSI